ncbi:hypothetical protein EW145_g3483 [Phellinidium pouzarii]|uniref:UDP-N-acetylglucosamine transferase subunit ALG13 n=1 Tax=Phellinidium pouzarii TaxID=167371 RepID=A0A4S4L8W4_9AGAM|nr:hypothetical protein EW145_g3483 [Phellinidium pouzarii]
MQAFVTVGSTQFDDLVEAVLSQPVLNSLREKGFTHLVVQCGKYAAASKLAESNDDGPWFLKRQDVEIEVWRYKPSLKDDYNTAKLVISHAGSGSIIDVLRLEKPLIVVPNPSLLDNHQVDLASELDKLGYVKASTTWGLAEDIRSFESSCLQPFPQMDRSRFRNLLDEEMVVTPATAPAVSPEVYESTHVHRVYDAIAPHFSSTRYKPWPVVAAFLARLPFGSVGLDAGTGNGKYLIAPSEREGKNWTIGLDRSAQLLDIAKRAGEKDRECVLGDVLESCWRDGAFVGLCDIYCNSPPPFDYRTPQEIHTGEKSASSAKFATLTCFAFLPPPLLVVQSLLRCLSPSHGRALIYVWATQQDALSKRSMPPESTASGMQKGQGKDVFVPWMLSDSSAPHKSKEISATPLQHESPPVYDRYYHMFDEGELRALVEAAAEEMDISICPLDAEQNASENCSSSRGIHKRFIQIVKDDWERSNHYVEFCLFER